MHFSYKAISFQWLPFARCKWWLLVLYAILSVPAGAQKQQRIDTTDKVTIQIVNAEAFVGIKRDTLEQTKLIGNVQLRQGDNQMSCDSAYINLAANNVEAFGNVHIVQPGGTQVQSDYLRYIGNTKVAYLKGNVKLDDGKNTLWSEDITYNLGTKIAQYDNGGTLQSDGTTVTSNKGTYNVNSKDARLNGDVIVSDPQYNTTSQDLGYNTATKVVKFYGPGQSVVVHDQKSTLTTTGGTYATKEGIAHFTSRTALQDKEQYIEGDKIDYNRNTGYGNATGNVVAIDTAKHTTLFSGFASYNEKRRTLLATIKPVLRQENGKDRIYIRADTFYSAPERLMQNAKFKMQKGAADTAIAGKKDSRGRRGNAARSVKDTAGKSATLNPSADAPVDTTAPRYYTGYRHVLIFSDSLQGRCDSISYSYHDSVMRMMVDPVAWSRKSQITGDTILLYTDSNSIKKVYVPANALIVTQSGPDKAQLFDQVQGKTLTGNFQKNTITDMIVFPAAQSIYYPKDDSGAYLGVNQSESERMKVLFRNQKIYRIILEQEPKQTMTPMEQADLPSMRLSRFKWLEEKRPKSKEELFK